MIEMLRLVRTGISTVIFWSYISIVLCLEDRIIQPSPTFNESNFISPTENDTVIPERLLIQLNDIQNYNDLLRLFGDPEDNGVPRLTTSRRNRTKTGRTGSPAVGAPLHAEKAECKIEEQMIELNEPENAATVYWPSCIRVKRCGGCCTSERLGCKPIETSILTLTVFLLYYNPEYPDTFKIQGTKDIAVEQHNRCSCRCKESKEDCDLNVQNHIEDVCKCVCKNAEQVAPCTEPEKIWDSRRCMCKCKNNTTCSTGLEFNTHTCRCETSSNDI